ncbi:MAG: gliding motility protein GldM [Bacteroidota bacterium]
MSIPKEPRQLMINLMYLVLTALLALNVSAEIINAFFALDKGLTKSSEIVEGANDKVMSAIVKQADAYKSDDNEAFKEAATNARTIVKDFNDYVQMVRDTLFAAAGGPDDEDPTKPKRKKDKDVTTRLLCEGFPAQNVRGLGYDLEDKINETRTSLLELIANDTVRQQLAETLPLKVEDIPDDSKKKTWADYKFLQMPVAAVFPILGKMSNDAKTSETAILNYLYEKVSGEDIKFDAFEPVVSARKGYIIEGEKYEAEVFLSAYSTQASGNMSISVNGSRLPVKEGKASYSASASSIGTKKYNVSISVTNPLTNKVDTYRKEFEYEVGRRSATVSADKMNVFYIGVDNPVSVAAAGISSNDLNVSGSGGGIKLNKTGNNKYNVIVTTPGDAKITLSGGGLQNTTYDFRVKRIPDPVAFLGREKSGQMGTGEFKAQEGIRAVLENFDFDARCNIQGFEIAKVPKRADPIIERNQGGRFSGKVANLVRSAKPGDIYYFDEIKARCPGDKAGRKINSMVFRIR